MAVDVRRRKAGGYLTHARLPRKAYPVRRNSNKGRRRSIGEIRRMTGHRAFRVGEAGTEAPKPAAEGPCGRAMLRVAAEKETPHSLAAFLEGLAVSRSSRGRRGSASRGYGVMSAAVYAFFSMACCGQQA